jgi:uncharacterized protein YktA (UPF0223 family)
MLQDTKRDLIYHARQLAKPYEEYSIDELADAYCDAVDSNNVALKDVYIAALILRFWYTIDKMYKANSVAPTLEHEDFFWWLYEAIEYAYKYRGWRDPSKKLNAKQCINKCIETIKLQKYYDLRLDKRKAVNHCCSFETPIGDGSNETKTIGEMLEAEGSADDYSTNDTIELVQSYINRNKIIEAILIDNIAFNDVQKHYKKTVKVEGDNGEVTRYVEHSSEFWPYRLIQIVSKLPFSYKKYFMARYDISDEKLSAVLEVIDKSNNQKLYRYLDKTLAELRMAYA